MCPLVHGGFGRQSQSLLAFDMPTAKGILHRRTSISLWCRWAASNFGPLLRRASSTSMSPRPSGSGSLSGCTAPAITSRADGSTRSNLEERGYRSARLTE